MDAQQTTASTELVTAAVVQAPAKRKPGPRRAEDVPKIRRITPAVRGACVALATGQAKTITEAAAMVGIRRDYLSSMLGKPHVEEYLARETKRHVCGHVTAARAGVVFKSLLDDESPKIRREVSDRILTAAGALPAQRGGGITINNTNAVQVGYVIDLTE